MIKKILLPLIILTTIIGSIHSQTNSKTNGWEFLEWKADKQYAFHLMDQKKVKYADREFYVTCEYEDMLAVLYFDDIIGLTSVEQVKTFGIYEKEFADSFALKLVPALEKKFGKPAHKKDDLKEGKKRIIWITDYTLVILNYNYKQGEVEDELGKNAYHFSIEYKPI